MKNTCSCKGAFDFLECKCENIDLERSCNSSTITNFEFLILIISHITFKIDNNFKNA